MRKHLQALNTNYRRAPYYSKYMPIFEEVYAGEWEFISELNVHLIERLKSVLELHEKPTVLSSDLELREDPTDRLIDICKALGADTYLAGQGGADYMDLERFEKNGLKLTIQEFQHPVYPQLFGEFHSHLSIVDLLFNCGPESMNVIREGNAESAKI
jgi:hypothetical protein